MTGPKNCSPVSTINFSAVSTTLANCRKDLKWYRWHTQGPGGHIYEKNLKSKSRVRLSLKNTDPRNRIRKNGSATLGTDTLKIFHESLSCFACNYIILLLLWTSTHTLCSNMFCYFISDPKVTGIRMPEAGGVDLTQGVEQLGGFHYFDNKPHTGYRYKNTEARQNNVLTERQTDRQTK